MESREKKRNRSSNLELGLVSSHLIQPIAPFRAIDWIKCDALSLSLNLECSSVGPSSSATLTMMVYDKDA